MSPEKILLSHVSRAIIQGISELQVLGVMIADEDIDLSNPYNKKNKNITRFQSLFIQYTIDDLVKQMDSDIGMTRVDEH